MAKLEPEERKKFQTYYNKEANRLSCKNIKTIRDSVMIVNALVPDLPKIMDSLDNMFYYKMHLEEN